MTKEQAIARKLARKGKDKRRVVEGAVVTGKSK